MFLGLGEPFVDSAPRGRAPVQYWYFVLARRIDHAGDMAGAGQHEAHRSAENCEPSSTDFAGAMWSSRVARL